MNLKELIRFSYGLFMGTSTPFLKPTKRFLFPVHRHEVDRELGIFLGGSGLCGVLARGPEALVVNTNQGEPAKEFRQWVDERKGSAPIKALVLNSVASDFSRGIGNFLDVETIYVGPVASRSLRESIGELWERIADRVRIVREETVLELAGERVRLMPSAPAATESDLVVYLENHGALFLGPLFYNRIHPILRVGPGLQPETWIRRVDELLMRFPQAKVFVPAEGDIGTIEDVREFVSYLRSFTDPDVEFSACRQKFDWPEIPSYTSLEENFDLLREKIKSHTSLK